MNLSRTISLSFVDKEGNEIPLRTPVDQSVEIIIPRDPSFRLSPMTLQNVTGMMNDSLHQRLFNLHSIDFSETSSFALHLEVHPLSVNLSYLMIYRFDISPVLNSSLSQIDGWSLLCSSTNKSLDTHFFGNNQTFGHHSLIFDLRQLNSTEIIQFCSTSIVTRPLTDQGFPFTDNYEVRLYTSSCFHFDENTEEWKSDGLTVGPLSNHFEIQCSSTHVGLEKYSSRASLWSFFILSMSFSALLLLVVVRYRNNKCFGY